MLSGDRMVATDTPLARLGHATCYDLRFPELFRSLAQAGCEIVLIPSAFTRTTGQAHWQVLLRARAIENQCFVVAPNQCGAHTDELISYGHSMIIDPWGQVLQDPWGQVLQCANGTDEQVVLAELSGEQLDQVRQRLPALKHRRSELF